MPRVLEPNRSTILGLFMGVYGAVDGLKPCGKCSECIRLMDTVDDDTGEPVYVEEVGEEYAFARGCVETHVAYAKSIRERWGIEPPEHADMYAHKLRSARQQRRQQRLRSRMVERDDGLYVPPTRTSVIVLP